MINKDNTLDQKKNNGITPDSICTALDCLPHNFVVLTQKLLEKWKSKGKIEKTYSKVYISRVKTADKGAFNEDIMKALIEVGSKNQKTLENFGRAQKKTSKTN
ncbi:hypothetical protein [Flavobacterium sp. 14A]|uniref:hypothetical protein n=1 Tax=Flavobacterium sp. 14A TaxID=2735896 RepID=UPI00156D8E7A|nr:hypothetical protein [Flavobacterium sp. 14A]NRT11498.1 effector-binding domain-containing protein [Flavobacterium sp. 14A]